MNKSQEVLVSIIIPTYNGAAYLPAAVRSCNIQTYKNIEIIVVDNGSTDNTLNLFQDVTKVKIIQLDRNYGFSYAVNIGIRQSRGDYIALLNNDAVARPSWIEECIKPFASNRKIACVTPKILDLNNTEIIDSAGDTINIVGQAWSEGEGKQDLESKRYNVSKFIFSASGCAPVYSRQVLNEVGLFEEVFFAYFEDVDLSWRIQKAGYKVWFHSSAEVDHYRRRTSSKMSTIDELLVRNYSLCYLINTPLNLFAKRASLIKALLVYFHTIYWLARTKRSDLGFKAFVWLVANINTAVRLRKVRMNSKVSVEYLDHWRKDKILKVWKIRF